MKWGRGRNFANHSYKNSSPVGKRSWACFLLALCCVTRHALEMTQEKQAETSKELAKNAGPQSTSENNLLRRVHFSWKPAFCSAPVPCAPFFSQHCVPHVLSSVTLPGISGLAYIYPVDWAIVTSNLLKRKETAKSSLSTYNCVWPGQLSQMQIGALGTPSEVFEFFCPRTKNCPRGMC